MPHSSDSSDSSFSRSPPPGKQDSSDDVRKVQRREKNRIAAQKSRQRQTQKADTLHLGPGWMEFTVPEIPSFPGDWAQSQTRALNRKEIPSLRTGPQTSAQLIP
ncbi:basic leucine zipper transcriptional factor ATF-like isoform X2 [Meriones unguiculatus]|uniref:basic leucine zipper transcriptional factor ATF-like isoform X2 n=1 Tax=Meriones unguiculatus TaxID=10047 RepID=UPI00293F5C9D|nr:basic leucine zipper transcriptional factor ATF-like isoform X2 [Meriones unguiculatus]